MDQLNIFRGTGQTGRVGFPAERVITNRVGPDYTRRNAHPPHNISGPVVPSCMYKPKTYVLPSLFRKIR